MRVHDIVLSGGKNAARTVVEIEDIDMATFTVRRGKNYAATISLGPFERLATNEMIAAKLQSAGFSQIRVWGVGSTRYAEAYWHGADATAELPPQIAHVSEMGAPSKPA
jgi:hypothetical protein